MGSGDHGIRHLDPFARLEGIAHPLGSFNDLAVDLFAGLLRVLLTEPFQVLADLDIMNHAVQRLRNGVAGLINLAHGLTFLLGEVAPHHQLAAFRVAHFPCASLIPRRQTGRNRLTGRPVQHFKQALFLRRRPGHAGQRCSTSANRRAPLQANELLALQLLVSLTGLQLTIPPFRRRRLELGHIHGIIHAAAFVLVAQDGNRPGPAGSLALGQFSRVLDVGPTQISELVARVGVLAQLPQADRLLRELVDQVANLLQHLDRFSRQLLLEVFRRLLVVVVHPLVSDAAFCPGQGRQLFQQSASAAQLLPLAPFHHGAGIDDSFRNAVVRHNAGFDRLRRQSIDQRTSPVVDRTGQLQQSDRVQSAFQNSIQRTRRAGRLAQVVIRKLILAKLYGRNSARHHRNVVFP